MKVEYLIAWEDNTWTTEIHEVKVPRCSTDAVIKWAHRNLLPMAKYRNAVLFALYSYPSQDE